MESEVLQLPLAPALVHRRRMRHAWIVLGAYIFMRIFMAAWFEWAAYKFGVVEDIFLFFEGLLYFSVFITSFVVAVKLAIKRAFAPALIYTFIAFIAPFIQISPSLNMEMKARIFAAYPNLCQTPIVPGQRVSICYGYSVPMTGGDNEHIYFNPGDEMSLPPRQWPEDIKRMFNILVINSEDDLCGVRKTRHIVDHVYWMSYDCWRH